jgi:hypothetical protein
LRIFGSREARKEEERRLPARPAAKQETSYSELMNASLRLLFPTSSALLVPKICGSDILLGRSPEPARATNNNTTTTR